jgi:polyisoprenoid-binding protein YceI
MKNRNASVAIVVALLLTVPVAMASQAGAGAREDATASTQYQALHVTTDPKAADAGQYKLDPHHTSVTAKLAHMDLSHYTLRFDSVSGGFAFDPARATASNLQISLDPASVDTGDHVFDKRIADRYFETAKYPSMTFTAATVKLVGDRIEVNGMLDFHGVKQPLTLRTTYRGFTHGRMGFSGEASFKRSAFDVGQWVPLEADEVTVLIETEFVKA